MYSTIPINNSVPDSSKRRWFCTYLILFGVAGLVGLGFVIAILTIVNLNKMTQMIENYMLLTSNLKDVILLSEKILDETVKELPAIKAIISKITEILTWFCKQNPEAGC